MTFGMMRHNRRLDRVGKMGKICILLEYKFYPRVFPQMFGNMGRSREFQIILEDCMRLK